MLNGSLSYKAILRIISIGMIAFGLYRTGTVLFSHVMFYGSGAMIYRTPLIVSNPGVALTALFYGGWMTPGPFSSVSVGLLGLALSTRRVHLVYWNLQVLLWLGSMSLWFPVAMALSTNGINVPGSFTPFFVGTLIASVLLLIAYVPVVYMLRKLLVKPTITNPLART